MIFLQDDCLALLDRQMLHGLGDLPAKLGAGRQVFDGFDRPALGGEVFHLDAFGHRHQRRTALFPHPVAAQIQRDAVEPGRKFRVPLEAGQRAERAEKRLLGDVARVFLASERAIRKGEDRAAPTV